MNRQQLVETIRERKTFLCVGLDTDIKKIPAHLLGEADPVFEFNKAIIDATAPFCMAAGRTRRSGTGSICPIPRRGSCCWRRQ